MFGKLHKKYYTHLAEYIFRSYIKKNLTTHILIIWRVNLTNLLGTD